MKTIHLNNQQPLCEKRSFGFSLLLQSLVGLWQLAKKKLSSLYRNHGLTIRRRLHLVSRDSLAGLNALINSATANTRRYSGLACIGVFAPLSTVFYRLFDVTIIDKTWYHVNYYYLFHVLGVHSFQAFFWILGVFLIIPKKYSPEYWVGPFLGYPIIKAALIIQCTSNEQWHQSIHWSLYIAMGLTGLCVALGINFFSWVKFHRHDGLIARMDGILKTPFEPNDKLKLIEKTWGDIKGFKKEL